MGSGDGTGDGEVGPAIGDRQVLGDGVEDGDTGKPLLEDRAQPRDGLDRDQGTGAGHKVEGQATAASADFEDFRGPGRKRLEHAGMDGSDALRRVPAVGQEVVDQAREAGLEYPPGRGRVALLEQLSLPHRHPIKEHAPRAGGQPVEVGAAEARSARWSGGDRFGISHLRVELWVPRCSRLARVGKRRRAARQRPRPWPPAPPRSRPPLAYAAPTGASSATGRSSAPAPASTATTTASRSPSAGRSTPPPAW